VVGSVTREGIGMFESWTVVARMASVACEVGMSRGSVL